MATIYFVLVIVSISVHIIFGSKYLEEECDRVRRPLHLLTIEERELYVEGFQGLRKNNKLEAIAETHHFEFHTGTHHSSAFFYYHSYFIWEIETQIRALGEKFKCFAMPYWDLSYDSGNEQDPFVYQTVFGSDGNPENDYCVEHDLWNSYYIPPETLCEEDEEAPYCCLKREISPTQLFPTTADFAAAIVDNERFIDFVRAMDDFHGRIHHWSSNGNHKVAMHGSWAADDPIFFLLHSYLDYAFRLWTSCWNYDKMEEFDLNTNNYIFQPFCDDHHNCSIGENCSSTTTTSPSSDSSDSDSHEDRIRNASCGATEMDDIFNYRPMNVEPWSLVSRQNLKLKDLYNIKDWGVRYELGTFYKSSRINQFCEANHRDFLNHNEWFEITHSSDNYLFDIAKKQQSESQNYIDGVWDDLDDKEYDDMDIKMKYKLVESLACKYNRRHNANSCWNEESFKDLEIETCSGRGMSGYEVSQLSLEEFLDFDGVRDNKCLRQIRENAYYLTDFFNDDMKLKICDGEWD
eukprot:27600_1